VAPRGLTFGNAGRNFLNIRVVSTSTSRWLKHFKIGESGQLEFRAEAFNVFNHSEFRVYDPDNPGSSGNNIISCYAGPSYSAGFKGCRKLIVLLGLPFCIHLMPIAPAPIQFGLKLAF